MQTCVHSSQLQSAEMAIDPAFLAGRVALYPLDYAWAGQVLGHYRYLDKTSGSTWNAGDALSAMRWPAPDAYFVLLKIRIGTWCSLAFPGSVINPAVVKHVRNWPSNPDAQISDQGKDDSRMGNSKACFGTPFSINGTADANPFGRSGAITATVLGNGTPMQEMFSATANGGHPMVYEANEGYAIMFGERNLGGGGIAFAMEHEWAEVALY